MRSTTSKNRETTKRSSSRGRTATSPVIECPSCGTQIPVADAIKRAFSAREADLRLAEAQLHQQEAQWHDKAAANLETLKAKLIKEHAGEVKKLQAELRLADRETREAIRATKKQQAQEVADLLARLKTAEESGQQRYLEGKAAGVQRTKALEEAIRTEKAEKETLTKALERRQVDVSLEVEAAFDRGRVAALDASREQIERFQQLYDELRQDTLNREKEWRKKLSEAAREAAKQAHEDEAIRLAAALKTEEANLRSLLAQERAVERQGFEDKIQHLRCQIEELHQKAQGTATPAIGDAAEESLEVELRSAFQADGDLISRTKKGQKGADLLLAVARAKGMKILIESKWTQAWESTWVRKAKADGSSVNAEIVVIVSRTLPATIDHLTQVDDVWVVSPPIALYLIKALRQGLIAVERAKRAADMDESRMKALRAYLTGAPFRLQVESLVRDAQQLLDNQTRERTQHERAWKESRGAFDRILHASLAIWSDLDLASGGGLAPSEAMRPYLSQVSSPEPAVGTTRRG